MCEVGPVCPEYAPIGCSSKIIRSINALVYSLLMLKVLLRYMPNSSACQELPQVSLLLPLSLYTMHRHWQICPQLFPPPPTRRTNEIVLFSIKLCIRIFSSIRNTSGGDLSNLRGGFSHCQCSNNWISNWKTMLPLIAMSSPSLERSLI